MVLELLAGHGLLTALQQRTRRISEALCARYMPETCYGLAELHALGLVRRDINQESLFLSRRVDGHFEAKLMSFGISKWLIDVGCFPRMDIADGAPVSKHVSHHRHSDAQLHPRLAKCLRGMASAAARTAKVLLSCFDTGHFALVTRPPGSFVRESTPNTFVTSAHDSPKHVATSD